MDELNVAPETIVSNNDYIIEMREITKIFPGIIANDNITLQLKRGEIHALLGENGAGKSTLMSVLFGLYQAESGEIYKNGEKVEIKDPNDANKLGIGMVHQHFKLVDVFTVLENIILGVEPTKNGFLQKSQAREKLVELSERYMLKVDPDALVENITVGMQQRVEILKMLYRENEILIFDEPTAVLTPQEIKELMAIMVGLAQEGKSILFITHKLNEIMAVADRCTVLRKGHCMGTVDIDKTTKTELSRMMVGRDVDFIIDKAPCKVGDEMLRVEGLSVVNGHKTTVSDVSFNVRRGEIVCVAGIEGNGQSDLVYALTGLMKETGGAILYGSDRMSGGKSVGSVNGKYLHGKDTGDVVYVAKDGSNINSKFLHVGKSELNKEFCPQNDEGGHKAVSLRKINRTSIRQRNAGGISHIPEDRHKFGLVLDFPLEYNLVLQRYFEPEFCKKGILRKKNITKYANKLIVDYDIRSSLGAKSLTRSMSGGNQQKAIVAREIDKDPDLLIAVQPTRGLDVGAIEYIHKMIVRQRDNNKAVLLISLELDEVMNLSDRIYVMYEGKIVADLDPKEISVEELGLYMAGAKKMDNIGARDNPFLNEVLSIEERLNDGKLPENKRNELKKAYDSVYERFVAREHEYTRPNVREEVGNGKQ
ncbi:MAG: ABC transporter ATP-binding protein [Clostridia bacterium]|nr:ABC transporter ATP-binding protein [Clostridia bacterium]